MPPADDKEARRRILLELLAEIDGPARVDTILFSAAVDQYLADLATRSKSKWTGKMNRSMLTQIVRQIGDRPLASVNVQTIEEWRAARLAEGIAHGTLNTRLATLSSLFNVAKRRGQVPANPTEELKFLSTDEANRVRIARAISDWDCSRLLAAGKLIDEERGGVPQELTLRALILTGARWGELVQARWLDVDREGSILKLRGMSTKNGSPRKIPLDRELLRDLEQHERGETLVRSRAGTPHTRSPTSFATYLRDTAKRAGIPRVDEHGEVLHIHALRHTFITRLMRAGVPVQHIQRLSGHKDITVLLEVYTHFRVDDLRKATECLPPLGVAGNVKKVEGGG